MNIQFVFHVIPHKKNQKTLQWITVVVILLTILLPIAFKYPSPQIPYNGLELTGTNYAHSILHGNPRQSVDNLRIPCSTFNFICQQLFEIENVPVSKLLSMEENFNKFLGTLEGVHIPASISAHKAAAYHNCKGLISQDVMAACNFNMKITYLCVG